MKAKEPKLIREIKEIIDNKEMHFWSKCKLLVIMKTYYRPGSYKGDRMIREYVEGCAGKFRDRFESAYIRPYLDCWVDRDAYDYVNSKSLNEDPSAKIGRNPRGIKLINKSISQERFGDYLERKYPEAFVKFEEIKKVQYGYIVATENSNDIAWDHIFGHRINSLTSRYSSTGTAGWRKVERSIQESRRELDLAMERARADYKNLKRASKLPPRDLYNKVSLSELQSDHRNHTYAIFNGNYITTNTTLHYDNSDVHHGLGKLVRTDREISISNSKGVWFTSALKSYSGHFVLNNIEEQIGKAKRVKVPDELKQVQLNPKMEVIEKIAVGPFRIFARKFLGAHYDYCVLRDGITYHAPMIQACISGWIKKAKLKKADQKIFNMRILTSSKGFNFCKAGVEDFCNDNGLDSRGEYSIEELKKIVKRKLSFNHSSYGQELRQIGVL